MRNNVLLVAGILLLSISCKSPGEISNPGSNESVIATFADQTVTLDELKSNYYRNTKPEKSEITELREFFPSYIDYRLKLYEGFQQGYHRDSTVQSEFKEFASEIAYRYWIENDIKKNRIQTFMNRFEQELKAFHILKELPLDALPGDTADVFNELVAVRDSLLNGAVPEEMNDRHSSKRDGNPVGGQLSWITAGSTIQPFEDAVFSLNPGDISMPVRSQFGYHLIILQEARPRTPQRLVKHIFVRKNEEDTGSQKIQQAFGALEADSSWNEVVQNYTEDSSTRNRDGLLGWIGYGTRYPAELIDSAMNTNPENAYSEPYEVSYGHHIMKIDSVRTFTNDKQKEEFVVERLEQLGRLDPDRNEVFERIANETDLKINRANFNSLPGQDGPRVDETEIASEKDLVHFNGQSYTTEHFQQWLNRDASVDEVMGTGDIVTSYRDFIIKNNLIDITRNHFPDFAWEVDHFLEGLIVFEVNENHIWNPEAVEGNELRGYYESNKNQYKKEKTFKYTEVLSVSDSLINIAYQKLVEGAEVNKLAYNLDEITIYQDSTSNPQNPVYSTLESLKVGEFSEPVSVDDTKFIYVLNETKPERMLSFEEAIDKVFSDYQPIHEQKYLDNLKKRYNLVLYPENIE